MRTEEEVRIELAYYEGYLDGMSFIDPMTKEEIEGYVKALQKVLEDKEQ